MSGRPVFFRAQLRAGGFGFLILAWGGPRGGGVGAVLAFLRKGTNVLDSLSQYELILKTTRALVKDAQEAYETGQIERDDRFIWVLSRLRVRYPGLSENVLAGTIESAVAWLKIVRGQEHPVSPAQDTSYAAGHRAGFGR